MIIELNRECWLDIKIIPSLSLIAFVLFCNGGQLDAHPPNFPALNNLVQMDPTKLIEGKLSNLNISDNKKPVHQTGKVYDGIDQVFGSKIKDQQSKTAAENVKPTLNHSVNSSAKKPTLLKPIMKPI